ncbi:MAG: hypothetical protein Q4A54_10725 [Parabacteroides sp.]|nr:hypothetical protein [Parabacteroides sp.]
MMKYYMKIWPLWILCLLFISCDKEEIPDPFYYDREVIAVFPPEGIEPHTFSGLVYQGLYKVTDSLKLFFRPVLPATYDEGLKILEQLAAYDQQGSNRLIIVADPTYVDDLVNKGMADKMLNTDSTKVLVLGAYTNHRKLYNAHIPLYGVMYKAGYIAGKMHDVDSVSLFLATDQYAYYKEASDGFIQGYRQSGKNKLKVDNLGTTLSNHRKGFNYSQEAYALYAPRYAKSSDLVMPICRESAMGFYRYNREYPGAFYTIGMDNDMSVYANDVPYSCVSQWEEVAVSVVSDWSRNRLKRSYKYGLKEGGTIIVAGEKYQEIIQPLSEEIHHEAIQKETKYTR